MDPAEGWRRRAEERNRRAEERHHRHIQELQRFMKEERDDSLAEAQEKLDEALVRGKASDIEYYQRRVDELKTPFSWERVEPAA